MTGSTRKLKGRRTALSNTKGNRKIYNEPALESGLRAESWRRPRGYNKRECASWTMRSWACTAWPTSGEDLDVLYYELSFNVGVIKERQVELWVNRDYNT